MIEVFLPLINLNIQIQREVKEKESRESNTFLKSDSINKSNWRFYQKSSHNMSELKEGEVQTIFTSPPYWNKRTYSEEKGLGNEKTSKEFVVNLSGHLRDCKRVLKDRFGEKVKIKEFAPKKKFFGFNNLLSGAIELIMFKLEEKSYFKRFGL